MKDLSKYPTPVAGLALGIAGLGAFWSAISANHYYALFSALLAGLILLPLFFKFMLKPQQLISDLKHPTVGSVVPTMAMALMLVSHVVGGFYSIFGVILWSVACIAHISFMLTFFYYRVRDPHLNHIVPSWYVPPIGIVVASLTVPLVNLHAIGTVFVYFGLACYVIMLPVVLYRLIMGDRVEEVRQPTLAILAAPPSLILAGYLSVVTAPSFILVVGLFAIALLMTLVVYLLLFRLLQLPFSPAYSAFTFPLVISATATHKVGIYFASLQEVFSLNWVVSLSLIEGIIASLVVVYVTYRYFIALCGAQCHLSNENKNFNFNNS